MFISFFLFVLFCFFFADVYNATKYFSPFHRASHSVSEGCHFNSFECIHVSLNVSLSLLLSSCLTKRKCVWVTLEIMKNEYICILINDRHYRRAISIRSSYSDIVFEDRSDWTGRGTRREGDDVLVAQLNNFQMGWNKCHAMWMEIEIIKMLIFLHQSTLSRSVFLKISSTMTTPPTVMMMMELSEEKSLICLTASIRGWFLFLIKTREGNFLTQIFFPQPKTTLSLSLLAAFRFSYNHSEYHDFQFW